MPIVRRSAKEIRKRGGGRVDWERVRKTTEQEIADQMAADSDTAAELAKPRDLHRVYNPPMAEVKTLRGKMGLSQAAFAQRFGFSARAVQQWEQARTVPNRHVRILLRVLERAPQAVERALGAGSDAD